MSSLLSIRSAKETERVTLKLGRDELTRIDRALGSLEPDVEISLEQGRMVATVLSKLLFIAKARAFEPAAAPILAGILERSAAWIRAHPVFSPSDRPLWSTASLRLLRTDVSAWTRDGFGEEAPALIEAFLKDVAFERFADEAAAAESRELSKKILASLSKSSEPWAKDLLKLWTDLGMRLTSSGRPKI